MTAAPLIDDKSILRKELEKVNGKEEKRTTQITHIEQISFQMIDFEMVLIKKMFILF